MNRLNREGIKHLTVDVTQGWEVDRTPTDYRLDSLKTLVLTSDWSVHATPDRHIPNALIQWMPGIQILNISNLQDSYVFEDVYNTFPTQRLDELILDSFGLRMLHSLSREENDDVIHLLSSVQAIKCTLKALLDIRVLSWLWEWVPHGDDAPKRILMLVFPVWDAHIHTHMCAFEEVRPTSRSCRLELDVRVLKFNHSCDNVQNSPFLPFHGIHTPTRFTIRMQDMTWTGSNWLYVVIEPTAVFEADTYINIDLIFTNDWIGFNDTAPLFRDANFEMTQTTIKELLLHHIHKWEHSILPPDYYSHTERCNLSELRRDGVKTQLMLTLRSQRQHASRLVPIVDVSFDDPKRQTLYEKLVLFGDIKYKYKPIDN